MSISPSVLHAMIASVMRPNWWFLKLMREMEQRRDDLSRWEDDGGRAA